MASMLLGKLVVIVGTAGLILWLFAALLSDLEWGSAEVLDANTLRFEDRTVRLEGQDGPDLEQTCFWVSQMVPCGRQAREALRERIGAGFIWCLPQRVDPVGQVYAVCYAGVRDLNRWMVSSGWALARQDGSSRYARAELRARQELRGLWRLRFVVPAVWRSSRAPSCPSESTAPCTTTSP